MTTSPPAPDLDPIRLTQHCRAGGCAAKLRLSNLVEVLEALRPTAPASGPAGVLVSNDYADDAAVVQLEGDPGRGLVLTTDVIAPLVDDPETFGAVAATNAISDVYAMGGAPLWALNLAFFPDETLPMAVLHAILRGSAAACARMGVAVVGGHTVRDAELKFGLAVTGTVALDAVLSNRGAVAGQALVLSKALGTGIVSSAVKQGLASPAESAAAIASMTTPNGGALAIARRFGVTACTDVTGFGLFGHLRNILRGSGLAARIDLAALPILPGALDHAAAGRLPGGSKANLTFIRPALRATAGLDAVDPVRLALAADAQTSGGLLLCVPAERADGLVAALREAGLPAAQVGTLLAPSSALPAETIAL
jgi:selenide,water dikinase